jgi:CarboxypepD_reg-like domain
MANDNNIKKFTAYDIEKYHKGLLSAKERHDLEKAALDDPFLADALEGYAIPQVNVNADIAELKKRLGAKTEGTKIIPIKTAGKPFPWLRIAVILVLIAGAGLLSYQLLFDKSQNNVALVEKAKTEQTKPSDSITSNLPSQNSDTTVVNLNDNLTQNSSIKADKASDEIADLPQKADQDRKITMDSIKESLAVETTNPVTKLNEKTEEAKKPQEYKPLNNDAASPKADITAADDKISKDIKAKKLSDTDADGVANKAGKEAKLNEVTVTGYGAQRNESFFQQNQTYRNPNIFRGRVTDANGNAMPFANVTNIRDNVGTYSDAKGNFTLISADSVMNVQVRSLGFENNNAILRNNVQENQILMQEDKSLTANVLDSSKRNYSLRSRNAGMTFEEPEPADGWPAYDSYLANNVNIPDNLEKQKKSGADAVEVSFEVNKLGEPVNIKIEKSLCEKCDKEAIRLIREGPKWRRKAKKGRTTVTVPFNQ